MGKIILSSLLVFLFAFAKAQQEPLQYSRAKISLDDTHRLEQLSALDISIDHGIQKNGHFIISDFDEQELKRARDNGYNVDILISDVQAYYVNQNMVRSSSETNNTTCSNSTGSYPTPVNFNQGTMGGYLTYQELLNELDDMAAQYPNLISSRAPISNFITEGVTDNSVTPPIGNNPIYWLKISDNPNSDESEPEILYTSIHHAREPMSLMQLVFYMWYLLENYETDAEVQAIVNNTELYFVPVVNPDGYLYNQVTNPNGGGLWRKNRNNGNGVDNNRNYDYHINGNPDNGSWGGPGSSSNPNSNIYHGTGPFSEKENQAIKWFVEQHDFVLALNNHTFGELLYYPFGYADVDTPDDALFQALGDELTSQNGYNALNDFPFSGDSDDFMYGTVGTHSKIFAFTPEVGTSFWPPASSIIPTSQEMMFLNLTAAQVVTNYGALVETSPTFVGNDLEVTTSFLLKRLGISEAGSFTVTFNPVSSNITGNASAVTLSNLSPLETQTGSINYSLSADTEIGEAIEFDLIVNNGFYDNTIRISKIYGATNDIFTDNGDTTSNFTTSDWGTTSATFVSPSSSITDSPSGNYSNNENSTIVLLDPIDLTDAIAAQVTFYARWDIEDSWDYVQFEISTDDGATWNAQCGNFTTVGTNIQPQGEPLYDGIQNDWVFEEINLSDYLGSSILARFKLITDSEVTRDGFYFDDLKFNSISNDPLNVQNIDFKNSFDIFPNPVADQLTIKTASRDYKTTVYSILGQEIMATRNASGTSYINFTELSEGIYFLRLENDRFNTTFKIIKQ